MTPQARANDDRIEAHCPACNEQEAIVSGWQDTLWADGFAIALPMTDAGSFLAAIELFDVCTVDHQPT